MALIHLNNAGSSLPPDIVLDTVLDYLKEEAVTGGYEAEAKYAKELNNVYTQIATLINAKQEEIAIVENASMGWHLAFNGIDFKPGDEVITSEMEYVTNHIGFLNLQKQKGIKLIVIPNDPDNNFEIGALERAINKNTKLITITHIASTAGNILPVAEIGQIARKHNILYLVDACQSVGQLSIDVEEIGCDMLSVTGRKYLRAPRGTGFLYVRKNVQDQLRLFFLDGRSVAKVGETEYSVQENARRFELYEKNRALVLGLGAAVGYALEKGLDWIAQRIGEISTLLRNGLKELENVSVHDKGDQLSGIITFSVTNMDAEKVKAALNEKDINVSIGRAHSTIVYMNKHHLTTVIRASVHYYNTEAEIGIFVETLSRIIRDQSDQSDQR